MRDLANYDLGEWLRLKPLGHALKQYRNDLWLRQYCGRLPDETAEFVAESRSALSGRSVALIVAFEQPWCLDWLLESFERHCQSTTPVVFDNSRDQQKRQEIASVCQRRGVRYLALPKNDSRHPNRSHGMAMTWIYRNWVKPVSPGVFSFIDHDLIPLEPVDFPDLVSSQPCYGLINPGDWAWNLWAGYCVFQAGFLQGRKVNFLYDFSNGVDTGGRNYRTLYSQLNRDALSFATMEIVPVDPSVDDSGIRLEIIDGRWLHLGGVGYNDNFARKQAVMQRIRERLENGDSWRTCFSEGVAGTRTLRHQS